MSTAFATEARYTPDDLLAMPNGKRYELIDGRLVERNMGAESSWVGILQRSIVLQIVQSALQLRRKLLSFIRSQHDGLIVIHRDHNRAMRFGSVHMEIAQMIEERIDTIMVETAITKGSKEPENTFVSCIAESPPQDRGRARRACSSLTLCPPHRATCTETGRRDRVRGFFWPGSAGRGRSVVRGP
jgi:hypothetical protein